MNTQGALTFLLSTVVDLYVFVLLIRFILQLVRADFYNPISQFIVKASNPVLVPLRKLVPARGNLDLAAIIAVLILVIGKTYLLLMLSGAGSLPPAAAMVLYSLRSLAGLLLNFLFFAVLVRVILSWVAPDPYNPFTAIMIQITEPVMAPVRRILPPMGGLDLSPLIVLLGIQFLMVLFLG